MLVGAGLCVSVSINLAHYRHRSGLPGCCGMGWPGTRAGGSPGLQPFPPGISGVRDSVAGGTRTASNGPRGRPRSHRREERMKKLAVLLALAAALVLAPARAAPADILDLSAGVFPDDQLALFSQGSDPFAVGGG